MEYALFLLYHLYRRFILPFRHIEMYIERGYRMDFFVCGILCETRPKMTKEEKYSAIMKFLEGRSDTREDPVRAEVSEELKITLGNNVRIIRERINHTQYELGMVLGIDQPEVSYIENGCRMITTPEIVRLFDYVPDINKNVFFGIRNPFGRPTDQKYIYVCSMLNSYGFEVLSDHLDLLMAHSRYHN